MIQSVEFYTDQCKLMHFIINLLSGQQ